VQLGQTQMPKRLSFQIKIDAKTESGFNPHETEEYKDHFCWLHHPTPNPLVEKNKDLESI
jgi:hypothetical protein